VGLAIRMFIHRNNRQGFWRGLSAGSMGGGGRVEAITSAHAVPTTLHQLFRVFAIIMTAMTFHFACACRSGPFGLALCAVRVVVCRRWSRDDMV
jgi:hypothetical protein